MMSMCPEKLSKKIPPITHRTHVDGSRQSPELLFVTIVHRTNALIGLWQKVTSKFEHLGIYIEAATKFATELLQIYSLVCIVHFVSKSLSTLLTFVPTLKLHS